MNIFERIHQTVTMPTDALDELRIIADEARSLPQSDREAITRGADEIEALRRQLFDVQMKLIEANAMRIALNEQLLEIRRAGLNKPVPLMSMTLYSGPLNVPTWPVEKG